MSEETKRHLFEAFYTTKGMNGTGLGLWVTSEILARHHASINLRSRNAAPSGTVFTIFFPALHSSGAAGSSFV